MEEKPLRAYLRLTHHSELGNADLVRLLQQFNHLENTAASLADQAQCPGVSDACRRAFFRALNNKHAEDDGMVESAMHWHAQPDCQIIPFESPNYPHLLQQTNNPPALLYAQGNIELLHSPCCAIVGSRLASAYGTRHAQWFAHDLEKIGFTVVSGMAKGIDTAAHLGALQANGHTIAVVGTGIDRVYPPGNQSLREQIIKRGLVVSEFSLGAGPRAEHFPRRNRIIAGLSLGTVVIEGSLRSGSLITAKLAGEQGREVFALPGMVSNGKSRGCHKLLREGACLIETPGDVCDVLLHSWNHERKSGAAAILQATDSKRKTGLSPGEQQLLSKLAEPEMLLDSLIDKSGLEPAQVTSTILQLELKGLLELKNGRVLRLE